MKDPKIKQLGDLISLDGLEKPGEGVAKVVVWGRPEKVDKLSVGLGDFAEKVEENGDVKAGEVVALADAMRRALTNELAPEQAAKLLVTLKARFLKKKKAYKSAEGVDWDDVEKKLEAAPEKLWSLQRMEDTGGEPDLMEYDKKTGEYIFMDCSAESPTGRRDCVYDREAEVELKKLNPTANYKGNAVSMVALMGVDLLNEEEYRELQTKGEFDKNSWSWLKKTPVDERRAGITLYGTRNQIGVRLHSYYPYHHSDSGAWRASLRV